jgi:hypothetical protein
MSIGAVALASFSSSGWALDVLWSQGSDGWTTFPSYQSASPPYSDEVADDFEVTGTIERLVIGGYNNCLGSCPWQPDIVGVRVRFHQWSASGPGAVQREEFFAAGDPNLFFDPFAPAELDVILHTPFVASGRHYLSVQVQSGEAFGWYFWSSAHNNPRLSKLWYRKDNGAWGPYIDWSSQPANDDVAFALYGCPPTGCAPAGTVNQCGQWNDVATPFPPTAREAWLRDLDMLSATDGWSVGNYSAIGPVPGDLDSFSLAMRWNGSSWAQVPTPNPGPGNGVNSVTLNAVDAFDATHAYAVGQQVGQDPIGGYVGGRVFGVRWNGQQWIDMNVPWPSSVGHSGASGEGLNDVVALSANEAWLVGRYWRMNAQITSEWPGVAFFWDGSNFDTHYLPWVSPARNQWANAVAATGPSDVWIVGDGTGAGANSYIWHWNGSSWTHVPGPTPGRSRVLEDIVALAANDVWAGGYYTDTAYVVHPWIIHWNGSGWTEVPTPAGGSRFAAWSPTDILTNGAYGWAHWNGTNWTAEPGPELWPYGSITSIDTVSPCDTFGVGILRRGGIAKPHTVRLRPVGSSDTDGDGVPDGSDNCPQDYNPAQTDCDADLVGDVCEVIAGTQHDCNGNGIPDECESFIDCDLNGVPDECQPDCNNNDIPDVCDIAGPSLDCNANGVPDECETFDDCNQNGINDQCDIGSGMSADSNGNGYPDECEALAAHEIAVTTIADVSDFGGGQAKSDLPGPDGVVSFREALAAAENTPGVTRIAFNIPKSQWQQNIWRDRATLEQSNGLFSVRKHGLTLDFTTQTRFTGDTNPNGGEVAIWGSEANAWGVTSILIEANDTTVRGLGHVGQRGYGVEIRGNNNRVIASHVEGPLYAGVHITSTWDGQPTFGNVIGGTAPGEGNLLIGGNNGVRIVGNTSQNVIIGNRLLSGPSNGVSINGSSDNRIGGNTLAERNLISGSGQYGEEGCPFGSQVAIQNGHRNMVEGNYIGTTADGSSAYPNQRATEGVSIVNSNDTTLRNNLISGIKVAGFNHCSGQVWGTAVSVSGTSARSVVEGNMIGSDASGTIAVPSLFGFMTNYDINTQATPTATRVRQNSIAFHQLDGVRLNPSSATTTLEQNAIRANGGLGINLQGTANGGQVAPTLNSAETDDAHLRVRGRLESSPVHSYTLEFFANGGCDGSGAGEGERFVGAATVTTDTNGRVDFDLTLDVFVAASEVVTATATDQSNGNSSAFSTCRTVTTASCFSAPGQTLGLMIAPDTQHISWNAYGPSVRYDLARGLVVTMSTEPASCVASSLTSAWYDDSASPLSGQAYYYLVRSRNACGTGPWSQGESSASCP